MHIVWKDEFLIDGGVIDEDHKVLIGIINDFISLNEGAASLERLKSCLARLKKYTLEHFVREESIMVSIAYPNAERHRNRHAEIVSVLDSIIADFRTKVVRSDRNHSDIHERAMALLRTWLVDHILVADADLKPYIEDYRNLITNSLKKRELVS